MTPEEATQLYNIEQRKYYEYCGYVVSYQNKIGESTKSATLTL